MSQDVSRYLKHHMAWAEAAFPALGAWEKRSGGDKSHYSTHLYTTLTDWKEVHGATSGAKPLHLEELRLLTPRSHRKPTQINGSRAKLGDLGCHGMPGPPCVWAHPTSRGAAEQVQVHNIRGVEVPTLPPSAPEVTQHGAHRMVKMGPPWSTMVHHVTASQLRPKPQVLAGPHWNDNFNKECFCAIFNLHQSSRSKLEESFFRCVMVSEWIPHATLGCRLMVVGARKMVVGARKVGLLVWLWRALEAAASEGAALASCHNWEIWWSQDT